METMTTARNDNSRFPFTSSQWQELEHQALVYKYMISGMPIPPDLLFSIQRSLDSSTRLLLHHHSPHHSIGVGWNCFQMGFGRKIDPEPGRCRRTDGKKWRCSKEAYPDSKYCERHMHRGRNRSRKPVEVNSAPNTPPALSISTKPMMNYPVSPFLYPQIQLSSSSSSSRAPVNGNVVSSHQDRFWLESSSGYSSRSEKDNSYGMKEEMDEHPFLSERCGSGTMSASMGGDSWNLEPLAMNNNNTSSSSSSSSSLMVHTKQRAYYDYDQLTLKIDQRKDEQPKKVMHHFFDESPQNDNVDGGNKDSSTTQLSISIPNGARDFFQTHNHK